MPFECGVCGAEYGSADDLQAHHASVHGTRTRPSEPAIPRSAQQKPMPDEAPAPEAATIRDERPGKTPEKPGEGGGAAD